MSAPVAAATPHTDAIEELLQDAAILVGRGTAPKTGGWQGSPGTSTYKAYAVLFPDSGTPEAGSLASPHSDLLYRVQITCVGATQDQTAGLVDRVKVALVGVRPVVAGRSCRRIQFTTGARVTRDDQVTPPVHYATPLFEFTSTPA